MIVKLEEKNLTVIDHTTHKYWMTIIDAETPEELATIFERFAELIKTDTSSARLPL